MPQILIGAEGLCHEWPSKPVLHDVSLGIFEGDRIGIVGRNGGGKTTLLEILSGQLVPDAGRVVRRNNISVGLLTQRDELDDELCVREAVVGTAPVHEWASKPRIRHIIDALIADLDWEGSLSTLSGGQRRRVHLARLLVGDWDVLLLDEPTNHLDLPAIVWLAQHLKERYVARTGAIVCVTHDRWFLDELCQISWEVHDRQVNIFEGGFSAYIQQRVERDQQAAIAETKRQNMLRKELAWLSRGAQARTSKPKFRIAEAQALIADVPAMRNPIELKRAAVSRLGKQVLELKSVTLNYGSVAVLKDIDWLVGPGDRYGILGTNGAGKSTLLRVITGTQKPDSGWVKIGKSVRFGLLSQGLDSLMERRSWRVRELLGRYKTHYVMDGKELTPGRLLERLGFDSKEFMSFIQDLSGGQLRRLALMCVLLDEPNVLVLDEPGNDLDTDMLAAMEDLLDSWPGTLFLVTHDRYLMERVTDHQFALLDGKLRHLPGGVDEFLRLLEEKDGSAQEQAADACEHGRRATQHEREQTTTQHECMPKQSCTDTTPSLSNSERIKLKRRFDSLARQLERKSAEIERLEQKLLSVNPSDYEALIAAQAALDEARMLNDEQELEWLELAERLGE